MTFQVPTLLRASEALDVLMKDASSPCHGNTEPPGDGNAGADQRVLRSMLKRSGYATSDLKAAEGPDHAREHLMIGHINDGMIMMKHTLCQNDRLLRPTGPALSRWEDDGGILPIATRFEQTIRRMTMEKSDEIVVLADVRHSLKARRRPSRMMSGWSVTMGAGSAASSSFQEKRTRIRPQPRKMIRSGDAHAPSPFRRWSLRCLRGRKRERCISMRPSP